MSKPLYVFDLDETLIDADSCKLWNAFLVEKSIVVDDTFLIEDKRLLSLYAQGKMDMEEYLSFSMAPLSNLPVQEVHELAQQCVEQCVVPTQFVQAKKLIAQLAEQQVDMLVISATVSFIVKKVAKQLGIKQAIGIDLIEENGCFTHQVDGVASYREGKVLRLQQWLQAQDKDYSEIHFYSDSINDLALCEYADYTYLVNPCSQLKAHSHRENWQLLSWQRKE